MEKNQSALQQVPDRQSITKAKQQLAKPVSRIAELQQLPQGHEHDSDTGIVMRGSCKSLPI